uniref:RING-type domain-containing protein n=1 Tax=Arcella intermedia TaxID=1963864 RepID=A0A6B2LT56_9EUKA
MECGVCFDQLEDPRVLPCGHTFCLKCLQQLRNQTRPKCRCTLPPVHQLPKNFLIAELLQTSQQTPKVKYPCGECEEPTKGEFWCPHEGFLCETHCREIHSRRTTKAHQVGA